MKQFYQSLFFKRKSAKNYLKSAVAGLAFLFAGHNTINAQVSTYSFAQSSGVFTPISGNVLGTATGNTSATNLNSEVYPITIPFGFNFNQVVYNSLNISSNGFITFGSTAPTATNTTPINSTATYEGSVSAWGRDISSFFDVSTKTGNISWETVGTAPNREIVIQWTNFRTNSATAVTSVYSFSFQIRLSETSNQIKVVYDVGSYLIGSTSVASTAQIGLRGSSPDDYNNRLNATSLEFTSSTVGSASNSSQAFNTVNAVPGMPSAGLTYTWLPPTCWAPIFTTGSATPNSITVNWVAPVTVASSYDIYYNTTNTAPVSTTLPMQTNLISTSATINSLASATLHYVWVRSNCGVGGTSEWSQLPFPISTLCQPPVLLTATGATICPGFTATLNATANAGVVLQWYDSGSGGNLLATGNAYTTGVLNNTTNYWVSASNIGITKNVGPITPASLGASSNNNTLWDLLFTVNTPLILKTVDVFSGTANQTGKIEVLTTSGTLMGTTNFTTTGAGTATPQTVTLNVYLPAGTYAMRRSGNADLFRNSAGASFPYSTPELVITGTTFVNYPAYYFYFYNLSFASGCGESDRQQVTATVDSNCLSTSEINKKNAIKVYPNPFSEVVNITKPELVKIIQVSDLSGKLIKTINQPESVIRLNDLSAGMYLLQLDMKDGSMQTIKVIKK